MRLQKIHTGGEFLDQHILNGDYIECMGRDDVAQERNVVLYKHVFLDGPVNLQHRVNQGRARLVHKRDAL